MPTGENLGVKPIPAQAKSEFCRAANGNFRHNPSLRAKGIPGNSARQAIVATPGHGLGKPGLGTRMLDPGRQRPMLKAVQPGVKLQLATCEKAQAQGEQEAGVFHTAKLAEPSDLEPCAHVSFGMRPTFAACGVHSLVFFAQWRPYWARKVCRLP